MFTGIATWIDKSVIGGWLTKIGAAISWLFKAWYRIVIALLLAACLWCYIGWTAADKRAVKWKRTAEVEMSLRIANEVAYKKAQDEAADLNKKQVESIKSQYAAIAERTEDEYEKRLADNRAALRQWMRTKAAPGIAQSTGASSPATVSAEVVSGASQTEFLVGAEDLEIASDNYSQLVALIEWAKSIGEVKPASE
jgi:hypothetical protein